MSKYNIIQGASYGFLLASKILFGGHSIKLVCLPVEADLINSEEFRVRIPVGGRSEPVDSICGGCPAEYLRREPLDPQNFDLIDLAMKEPQ